MATQNIYLYSCSGIEAGHDPFVYEHSLALITSGSMDVYTDNGLISYPAGTLSLIKRHQLLKVIKKPDAEIPFASINIFLDQESLKEYSLEHSIVANGIYVGEPNVLLDNDEFLKGYFNSLIPYFAHPEKLTPSLARLKTNEAIELLLRKSSLKNFLFDFSEPHKIDLEAYMNRHFSYNIPLEKFATLTGRSLSTFKRHFSKLYNTSPEKWLQKKRLDQAHFLITQKNKRPVDVYLEVGFENFSHFSTAFKKEFGINASRL